MQPKGRSRMDVKVIASRYTDRPKTDPAERIFRIADHIVVGAEKLRAGRMYVGDEFRAVVITLPPGQAQELHMHPATDSRLVHRVGHGRGHDGRRPAAKRWSRDMFLVHPRNSVHGLRNIGDDNFVYIALSIGA